MVDVRTYEDAIVRIETTYPQIEKQYSIQTNAGNISESFLQLFEKYDIRVGVSVDGSKNIHDSERKTVGGKPTFATVCKNIDVLQERHIPVSCLMVLTSNAFGEGYDYLQYFAKRNLHLKINPLLNYGEAYEHPELSLQQGDYAKYLIGVFEYILEKELDVSISPIDKILYAILFDTNVRECTFDPKCHESFLCIDHHGDIYPCGKYSDMKECKLGNVTDNLLDIFNSDILKCLSARRLENKPKRCLDCKYLIYCNAACSAEASIDGCTEKEPLLCADYMALFEYFSQKGLLRYKEFLLKRKEALQKRGV